MFLILVMEQAGLVKKDNIKIHGFWAASVALSLGRLSGSLLCRAVPKHIFTFLFDCLLVIFVVVFLNIFGMILRDYHRLLPHATCVIWSILSLLMFASSLNILLPRWITQYFYYYYSCVVPIWIWIRKTDNTSMKAKTWGYFLAKKNVWIWYRQWITLTRGLEYSDGSRGFQSRRKLRMNQPLVFSIESKKWSSAKSSGKTILG